MQLYRAIICYLPCSINLVTVSPSNEGSVVVLQGNDFTVNCTSTAGAVSWSRDGLTLESSNDGTVLLRLVNVTDDGAYTCSDADDDQTIEVIVEGELHVQCIIKQKKAKPRIMTRAIQY